MSFYLEFVKMERFYLKELWCLKTRLKKIKNWCSMILDFFPHEARLYYIFFFQNHVSKHVFLLFYKILFISSFSHFFIFLKSIHHFSIWISIKESWFLLGFILFLIFVMFLILKFWKKYFMFTCIFSYNWL